MTELHDQRPLSRVELMILARLSANGATENEIAKSLRATGLQLTDAALADCVTASLASLGAHALCAVSAEPATRLAPKGTRIRAKSVKRPRSRRFILTDSGRNALLQALRLKTTPSWENMCSRVVPALALGEQPGSAAAGSALSSAETMIANLLRRDRTLGELATVTQLCDQIVARALGMPHGPVTLAGIRAYALATHCGVASKAELEDIAARFEKPKTAKRAKSAKTEPELKTLATRLAVLQLRMDSHAKAPTKETIAKSLQRRWLSQQDEADDARPSFTLRTPAFQQPRAAGPGTLPERPSSDARDSDEPEALLGAVRRAIPMVGSDGRYGKENVFVSALWRQVARDQRLAALSLDGFKRWLVTANRNQLVALARADLIDDMDARLVEDSEIEDLGATFHFVLDRHESVTAPAQVHYVR